jgi:hypothetical protein
MRSRHAGGDRPAVVLRTAAAVLLALGAVGAAVAQSAPPAATPASPAAATSAPETRKDPRALEALDRMGAHLRSLKWFSLRADTTTDEVLLNGQKLQFGGTAVYRYGGPERLRIELRSDRLHRDVVFDGRTMTLSAPRMKLYATVPAPTTVGELVQAAGRDYGIELPLADLFLWGTPRSGAEDLASAEFIGPSRIAGQRCDHYAFRQPEVDWQLWIRSDGAPLPCKLVITTLTEPEQPQYTALLTWDLKTRPSAASFRFQPAPDARRIDLVRIDAAAAPR